MKGVEKSMRKFVCLLISLSLVLSVTGCNNKKGLKYEHFERCVLEDMNLEKKDISSEDLNAYYNLDYTIDNNDLSEFPYKRDHYAQVYSQSEYQTIATMYLIYTDYQVESEACTYFDDFIVKEKAYLEMKADKNGITYESGDKYLITMKHPDVVNWGFEGYYLDGDVVLFCSIVMATSDLSRLDLLWLKQIKKLCQDLGVRCPLELSEEIFELIK